MKKFIVNCFLFFLCTVFFYVILLMLWGSFLPDEFKKNINYRVGTSGYTYTRLHEVEKYNNINILFVGSSHAYRGFDTRIFKERGLTCFNLGTSSQSPIQTELLLDRYLDKLNPSTIVFEVYPYTFSCDGVESSVDVISNSCVDGNSIKMAANINSLKTYNTLLYAFVHRLFVNEKPVKENLFFIESKGNLKYYTTYIPGGFMESKKEWIGNDTLGKSNAMKMNSLNEKGIMTDLKIIQTKDGRWEPRQSQIKAFERILKKLKEKNIHVILVQAPINSKYYSLIKCNKEIDSYFSSKEDYYNFNVLMFFDNELNFTDYDHLNQKGVKKMNEAFIDKAFKKELIPLQ
ncbi:hypothetical protein [Flavobacterium sp.]|jgi:hypothetical protein|uniref:hypothetical protein n=1 Tax=Flavobacterium sp. TaxID=239 RepID=UPI0037BE79A1